MLNAKWNFNYLFLFFIYFLFIENRKVEEQSMEGNTWLMARWNMETFVTNRRVKNGTGKLIIILGNQQTQTSYYTLQDENIHGI